MKRFPSLTKILSINPIVNIVDIGANPIDGNPPYNDILSQGFATVTGFEPNQEALGELNKKKGSNETYLPHAIGDGKKHNLNLCMAPGMTSILEPNFQLLDYFHGFPEWAKIKETINVDTLRLDDVKEIKLLDYLKIDIQGAELMVFENATEKLQDCLVIHTEVEFLPMYKNQPLFSEVEIFLRKQGFCFHKFSNIASRVVKPLVLNNDPYAGMSQVFWADAVFIRDFTRLSELNSDKLLKLAFILHDIYESYDISLRALVTHDEIFKTNYAPAYMKQLSLPLY